MAQVTYLVVGSGGCGKTQFINTRIGRDFERRYIPTVGVVRYVDEVNNEIYLEKGGQELYGITEEEKKIMRTATQAFLCVDSPDRSFGFMRDWRNLLVDLGIPFMYVFTKRNCGLHRKKNDFIRSLENDSYLIHSIDNGWMIAMHKESEIAWNGITCNNAS